MKKRGFLLVLALIVAVTALTGCSGQNLRLFSQVAGTATLAGGTGISLNDSTENGGSITYLSDVPHLGADQEALILDFMALYYQALETLEEQNPNELFAPDAQMDAARNKAMLDLLIEIRSMQGLDLRLKHYIYELTCLDVLANDDGSLQISINEDAFYTFQAYPKVTTANYHIEHIFTIVYVEEEQCWKIRQHLQIDGLNLLVDEMVPPEETQVLEDALETSGKIEISWPERIEEFKVLALEDAGANVAYLNAHKQSQNDWKTAIPEFDHAYDRDAAVAYSRAFAGVRNPGWPVYDNYGGNCMNFASQSLYAGGIPMDYTGAAQWKWYGERHNRAEQQVGRTPSWSAVGDFYHYAVQNEGPGLVAGEGNFYQGQPGDLIQMGLFGRWRHTVVITHVIKDANGNTIDYLVASNTSDLVNFPVSASSYAMQRIIHIYGWNDMPKDEPNEQPVQE